MPLYFNVKVIFIEAEAPSVYAETIVAETDIKAVTGLWVETLKENQSYSDFLLSNIDIIVEETQSGSFNVGLSIGTLEGASFVSGLNSIV